MLLEHGDYHKDACHGTQVRGTAGERERERERERYGDFDVGSGGMHCIVSMLKYS